MNNFLVVLVAGAMLFASGCCCKSKNSKACPMDSMKSKEMSAPMAEETMPVQEVAPETVVPEVAAPEAVPAGM